MCEVGIDCWQEYTKYNTNIGTRARTLGHLHNHGHLYARWLFLVLYGSVYDIYDDHWILTGYGHLLRLKLVFFCYLEHIFGLGTIGLTKNLGNGSSFELVSITAANPSSHVRCPAGPARLKSVS